MKYRILAITYPADRTIDMGNPLIGATISMVPEDGKSEGLVEIGVKYYNEILSKAKKYDELKKKTEEIFVKP